MNVIHKADLITQSPLASRAIPAEALERLVYLVGCPRTGTTVMAKSFFVNERVLGCPSMTRFTNHVWRNRRRVDRRMLQQIFRMPAFYRERQAIRTLYREERSVIERRIHEAFASMDMKRLYQLYPLIYSLDPDCEKKGAQVACWADKGNDVDGMFDLARAFPQARFILIIRDPRATCASMQGQIERRRAEAGLSAKRHDSLVSGCIHWRHMMQTFLRFAARYPERSMFVRYEDFITDPVATMNRMFEFAVGGRVPEGELGGRLSQFKHKTKHDRRAVGAHGIDQKPLERWRQMLTSEEIELVTALTYPAARKLGYSLERSARLRCAVSAIVGLKGWRKRLAQAAKLAYLEATGRLIVPAA